VRANTALANKATARFGRGGLAGVVMVV